MPFFHSLNRIISSLIIITLLMSFFSAQGYALQPNDINAPSAIVIDQNTGEVVFEKDADSKRFPASTTKILTALLILEKYKPTDTIVIDKDSPFTTGSRIFVFEGESFTVEQLLHALLIESANDVALALAHAHSGSVEKFAQEMNKKAKSLGANHTFFVNPNGLHDDKHVTTARDLAIISKEAMKNPLFAKIVKTPSYVIPPTNKQPEQRTIYNANKFLVGSGGTAKIPYKGQLIPVDYAPVTGIKTGYTEKAGQCFVTSITKNDKSFIVVILGATGNYLYIDSRTLMDYATDETERIEVFKKGALVGKSTLANQQKISAYTHQSIALYLPKGTSSGKIENTLSIHPNLKLPLDGAKSIGTVTIRYNQKNVGTYPVYAAGHISVDGILGKELVIFDQSKWDDPMTWAMIALKIVITLLLWRIIMTWFKVTFRRIKRIMKNYTA